MQSGHRTSCPRRWGGVTGKYTPRGTGRPAVKNDSAESVKISTSVYSNPSLLRPVVGGQRHERLPAGSREEKSTACSTAASASSVRQRCERFQPSISRVQQSSRCWEILLGSGDVLCRRRQLQPAQGGTNIHPSEFAHEMCQQGGGAVFPVATSYPSTHRRGRLQGGEK